MRRLALILLATSAAVACQKAKSAPAQPNAADTVAAAAAEFNPVMFDTVKWASDSVRLAAARRLMTAAVFEARQAGSTTVETLVESGDPANRILAIVKSRAPDLVVVGSRGLGARAEHLLGGVSEAVVNRAPCPVLVVKPSDGEE